MLLLQGCSSHCSSIWAPARPLVPRREVVQWRRLPAPRRRWPPERAPVSFISLHFLVSLGVLAPIVVRVLHPHCSGVRDPFHGVLRLAARACVPHSVGFYAS